MAIFIGIYKGDERVLVFELKSKIQLGRSRDNGLVLDDPRLSSVHCSIELDPEINKIIIRDLNSKNGMSFNKRKVIHHKLYLNEIVTIGKHHLKLEPQYMNTIEMFQFNKENQTDEDPTLMKDLTLEKKNYLKKIK